MTCAAVRAAICAALMVAGIAGSQAVAVEPADFEATAAGVFLRRCIECHAAADPSGGLDVTSQTSLARGGDSGAVVIERIPAASLLLQRIESGEMPPEKNGRSQRLPPEEIDLMRRWIAAGARWPEGRVLDRYERTTDVRAGRDWWSLQPLTNPALPQQPVAAATACLNPVDAFIRNRLVREGIAPAAEADRRTLLRRLSFDLVGLPPTSREIEAFIADQSPDAYEQQVDRLLASPQFGERQARHWLDVARFAETSGYERDAEKPGAWRYRDWVVKAFNNDMPFDRFVTEQLAGDEVPDASEQTVIATGFLRLGTWDDEPNDPNEYQYERLEDLVHVTSTAFLGFTVKCARCHDHKFDPITHTDYYRMAAAFWPGPLQARDRKLLGGPKSEELGHDVLGWTDITVAPLPLHVLKKGDPHRPLHEARAGSLSCVPALETDFAPPAASARTTGRRLQLARWITNPANPLTPRVIVNRLWQHHFGAGLCGDPDNFGFNGPQPVHPELLDWLAGDFVANGWRLKRIHRLMVTSATYREASVHPDAEALAITDPANALLWRANRRRLDAESIRDAILDVSGELDRRIGGESFREQISAEALEGLSQKGGGYKASPPEACRRRSLYMFTKRGLIVPMMTAFDMCDTTMPTGRRDVSIVAPQALTLLNNNWVRERSAAFAGLVVASAAEPATRVEVAWRRALGRTPTDAERAAALDHVQVGAAAGPATAAAREETAWTSLCQVLLNTNEFLFLD